MSVRIGLSMAAFPFSSPRAMWRWVETCEDSKVDSIWQTDRLISPEPYLEPLTALAALAGGTSRLKFGMTVLVIPLRDPLVTAKQCATIDFLSGGRFLPAFGVGSDNAVEFRATSIGRAARGARADEALEVIARLWAGESVTFEGKHFRYEGASIAPLPKQQPLPLWIGGSSPAAIRRTARLGTGWLGGGQTAAETAPVVAAIRAAAIEAGRPIDDDHYGISHGFRFGSLDDAPVQQAAKCLAPGRNPADYFAVGDANTIIERCREFHAAGVSKFVLRPLGDSDDDILDQTRRMIEEVIPVVHAFA
ncbi:MAG: LLM class flavin-dependent oxidoreductase [Dehalococcoidia bacterium]